MSELVLTGDDTGRSFDVHVGDTVVIRLPENPTTGYRWSIDHQDQELLVLEGSDFSQAPDAAVGGGGTRTLRLRAVRAGVASVSVVNRREWERGAAPIDRFDVTLRISA